MAGTQYKDKRTDEQYFADIMNKYPPYTEEVYVYAINAALKDKAAAHGVDVIDIDMDNINSAKTNSKTGFSIGVGKERNQTAIWVTEHPPVTKTVERNGKPVGSYTVTPMTATVNTFTGGGFSRTSGGNNLDIGPYLAEANQTVGKAFVLNQSPEQIEARLAEQKAVAEANAQRRAEMDSVNNIGLDLEGELKTYGNALLSAEYQGLSALNEFKGIKPADLHYPKKKHQGVSDEFLNSTYHTAVALPENFNFLNVGDPSDHESVTSIAKDDPMARQLQINEVLKENLHTTAAHLKVVDELTSYEDEPHPLIALYEEKYGPIRELTQAEMDRVNLLEGKLPPVPENEKKFDKDGFEIKPEFKFHDKNIFVGGINIEDIGKPNPKISGGQVFYSNLKISPKNTTVSGVLNIMGGDPTKPIDEIVLFEGAATAASYKKILETAMELEPEKYAGKNILIASAYNANNFVDSAKILHHTHPNTPLDAIGDNDIKVKLISGSGRPELDNDGSYKFLLRHGSGTVSSKNLPSDIESQRELLKVHAGADAVQTLNKYFVDNPNRDEKGELIVPMAAAIIVNKGSGGLDSFIMKQQSPNVDGATPENQRLLDPKVDLNDVHENSKNLLRHKLKSADAQLVAEGKPKVDVATKLKSLSNLELALNRVLIDSPIEQARNKLQDVFYTRLDLNEYNERPQEPEVAEKAEIPQVSRAAASSAVRQPITTVERTTEIVDSPTQYKTESKAASYANKYGGGFMIPEQPTSAPTAANDNKLDEPAPAQPQNSSPRP